MNQLKALLFTGVVAVSAFAFAACSEDDKSQVGGSSGFVGGDSGGGGQDSGTDGAPGTTDGGCPNKPVGCFCGTPTTQKEWLNRCTESTALPVNLTFTPATTANIP
jgi:hypothetical protein